MHAGPPAESSPSLTGRAHRAAAELEAAGVAHPLLKAECLLEFLTGLSRLEHPFHSDYRLTPEKEASFRDRIRRLIHGEPLQYVMGQTSFMGFTIHCDPRALIPRPETEQLVECVLETPSIRSRSAPRLVDIGTGTGCIALALALLRPDALVTGIDASEEALELAKENHQYLRPERPVTWLHGSLLEPLQVRAHALIANLPYIPLNDWQQLDREVRDFEPRSALEAGKDGLDIIRRLIQDAPAHLEPGGMLFIECGEDQTAIVAEWMKQQAFRDVTIRNDLADKPRLVMGSTSAS